MVGIKYKGLSAQEPRFYLNVI